MGLRASAMLSPVFALFLACGSDDPGGSNGSNGSNGGDPDGGTGGEGDYETLASGDWELAPGEEAYYCVRQTIAEEVYISGFRAKNPLGTHHTVVTVGTPDGPDGVTTCDTFTNHQTMIFGSGVGSREVEFPEGVAMRIEAGQQVLVNLHLLNASDHPLTGTSGTEILRAAPEEVDEVAEVVLMGRLSLEVPPGESTQVGTCNSRSDATIFAVGPHMHQLGTHMKVVAESSLVGEEVLLDQPYDFENQVLRKVTPSVPVAEGDPIQVHCTYINTTGDLVTWGESSYQEMCFAGIYLYPAIGQAFVCGN